MERFHFNLKKGDVAELVKKEMIEMKMNEYERKWDNKKRRWIYKHREVIESHLGRKLRSNEHVHHIDGNPKNNNIYNLKILSREEHVRIHKPALKNRKCSIKNCKRKHHAKGLCNMHYMRLLRKNGYNK